MADASAEEQARRIAELEGQLTAANEERRKAEEEKAAFAGLLERIRETVDKAGAGGGRPGAPMGRLGTILTNPAAVIAFILVTILFVILSGGSKPGSLLAGLSETDYARGLITFLFSLGTIGIGIILTLAAFRPGPDAAQAFTRGKEIFTILVGILGTIVGFYFGTGAGEGEEQTPAAPPAVVEQDASGVPGSGVATPTPTPSPAGAPPGDEDTGTGAPP